MDGDFRGQCINSQGIDTENQNSPSPASEDLIDIKGVKLYTLFAVTNCLSSAEMEESGRKMWIKYCPCHDFLV